MSRICRSIGGILVILSPLISTLAVADPFPELTLRELPLFAPHPPPLPTRKRAPRASRLKESNLTPRIPDSPHLFLLSVDRGGEGVVVPPPSPIMSERSFVDSQFATSAGLSVGEGNLRLEPRLGLIHAEREGSGGVGPAYAEVEHHFQAEAGGRIIIFRGLSLSAAAKMPVSTVTRTEELLVGAPPAADPLRIDQYLGRFGNQPLTWRGEMGVKVGGSTEFSLFYDELLRDIPGDSREQELEQRYGTRLIFRFE